MSLESATYIGDLVASNPVSSDDRGQGDDHLRLIKAALQATLPNASKAFYFPEAVAKSANYSILAADMNKVFLASTTGGSFTFTLPTLAAGLAGWECTIIKTTTDTNPYFIVPPSGTMMSGEIASLSKVRRCIPGRRTRVLWTGSIWIAERVVQEPIGTTKEYPLATLPVGYEWANGETLASASTNYPEFYAANGNSGVLPDHCGRVVAGQDDMGGISSKNRLTGVTGSVNGDTLGATGGAETHTLTEAQLPTITPAGTVSAPTITSGVRSSAAISGGGDFTYALDVVDSTGTSTNVSSASAPTFTGTPFGSGAAHNNVQPTIIQNKIVVVE